MSTPRSRFCAALIVLLGFVGASLRADAPRLSNLATRASVGSGGNIMITGFVIGSGPTKTVLIRAAGPGLTSAFGLTGVLADPVLTLYNSANAQIGTNDNWNAADAATMTSVGAFPFVAGSKDAALVASLAPGTYTAQVSGTNGGIGLGLLEIYEVGSDPSSSRLINLSTRAIVGTDANIMIGGLVLSQGAGTRRLLIRAAGPTLATLGVSGQLSDPVLTVLGSNGATVASNDNWETPVGANAANATALSTAFVQVGAFAFPSGSKDAAILADFSPGNYTLQVSGASGSTGVALVEVYDLSATSTTTTTNVPDKLFVATLRPQTGASGSTAFGTASIQLTNNGTTAIVNVSFSNLSSTEVDAHLKIGPSGDYVFALPAGQVTSALWTFTPTGNYSSTDLLNALLSGNIYVGLDSSTYPSGELQGTFVQATGSQSFTAPAAPPAIDLSKATAASASRLLTQATFGPKQSEIDALTNNSMDAWITAQLALPFTSHHTAALADFNTYGGNVNNGLMTPTNRQAAWWKNVLTSPDQLRQRVAFALSEIMVISDVSLGEVYTEGMANYYDILGAGAFGNFRTLLENVTLNPVMGNYLSSVRNAKADPVAGTSPDENYAREVMQLFTIGLNLLQPDGTLKLDANGLPIPTYDQTTITEMAKVFTGWSYYSTKTNPNFRTSAPDYLNPMMLFPAYHDITQKNIVNGVVIPANQSGTQDLKVALDALFNHPNTGPFIAKQLIQRLVTSNPSPAYVYRVAQKFADNGAGVRGDMSAVVRAILTDYEARSPTLLTNVAFGKLKEPILRASAVLRAFNAAPANGRYSAGVFSNPDVNLDEASLRAQTVFNFFHPSYVLPGNLASAGLVAPEFEITDATFSIDVPNYLRNFIFPSATPPATLDLSAEQALTGTVSAQIDHLNTLFCGGNMPQVTRDRITTALNGLAASTTSLERAETAVLLVTTSPAGATQK